MTTANKIAPLVAKDGVAFPIHRRGTLESAMVWLAKQPESGLVPGFYLNLPDELRGCDVREYCLMHANRVASILHARGWVNLYVCACWAGDDSMRRCAISTCDRALDNGGLTDYGIRVTLGLEEEHPDAFVADHAELELVARGLTMSQRDLWNRWMRQVEVLRRRARS